MLTVAAIAMAPAWMLGRVPAHTDWVRHYAPWWKGAEATFTPMGADEFYEYLPDRFVARDELREGRFPLWNPYHSTGLPILGMQTANPLDPLILLELFLPTGFALGISYALLLFLAGLGLVLYLKDQGVEHQGALAVAGSAYVLNPYSVVWLENRVFLSGLALLPIALWALGRVLSRTSAWREASILALSIGYASVAGTLQTISLFLLLLTARWLWLSGPKPREMEEPGRRRAWLLPAGACLAGLLLGLLPLLAGVELLAHSIRLGAGGYYADENFLPWRTVALWLNPGMFSPPGAGAYTALLGFPRLFMSGSGWGMLGVLPLGLALLALVRRAGPRRERWFWGGLIAVTLGILFLQKGPVHGLVLKLLPWLDDIDLFRGLVVVNLGGALLAGFGAMELAAIWKRGGTRVWLVPWAVFLIGGVVLIGVARIGLPQVRGFLEAVFPFCLPLVAVLVLGWARRVPAGARIWMLAPLVALELGRMHFSVNPFTHPRWTYPDDPMIQELQKLLATPEHPRYMVRGRFRLLPPNTGEIYRLPDVRGYTSLPIARYRMLLECAEGRRDFRNNPRLLFVDSPIYRLLGVAYVFSRDPLTYPRLEHVGGPWSDAFYRVRDPLPRAFLVHDVVAVPGEAAMRAALSDASFDPASRVYLEDGAKPFPATAPPPGPESVRILSLEPTKVRVAVTASAPGMLVLADPFYPGWRAKVDGRPARIYPANWGVRGVAVLAGDHEVIFEYKPRWLGPGMALSVAALLAVGAGFALRRRP